MESNRRAWWDGYTVKRKEEVMDRFIFALLTVFSGFWLLVLRITEKHTESPTTEYEYGATIIVFLVCLSATMILYKLDKLLGEAPQKKVVEVLDEP